MTQFQTVEQLQAEIKRLWALVVYAYEEGGHNTALSLGVGQASSLVQVSTNQTIIDYWLSSKTYAALQPKEGE